MLCHLHAFLHLSPAVCAFPCTRTRKGYYTLFFRPRSGAHVMARFSISTAFWPSQSVDVCDADRWETSWPPPPPLYSLNHQVMAILQGFRFRTRYYWSLLRQSLVRTPQNPRFFLLVNVWMRAMLPAYLRLLLDLARVRSCCADILSLLSCIDQRQRRSIGRILVISFISGCCHMCRYRVCFGGDIEGFGHWELMSSLRNLTRNISIPGN